MVRFFRFQNLLSLRRGYGILLALALLLGLLSGGFVSGHTEQFFFHMMHTAAKSRVSIVCLLPVLLLPVLCSAFAVYIGLHWLLIPIAFSKAFLISYICASISCAYPVSGKLFAFLVMFSDILSLPVLCWYWLRSLERKVSEFRSLIIVLLLLMGISFIDYQVISPFLVSLLS